MKLELKHLAPYLDSRVKVQWLRQDGELIVNDLTISDYPFLITNKKAKPILRPLSDLTKELEFNNEKFTPSKDRYWGNE